MRFLRIASYIDFVTVYDTLSHIIFHTFVEIAICALIPRRLPPTLRDEDENN